MSNFTKGEWTLYRVNHSMTIEGEVHVVASEGYPSAFVPSWIDDKETSIEAIANAHLIAAAPELYELLDEMAGYDECQRFKKQINELLAKARGEQK